jgi:hypothetical protein
MLRLEVCATMHVPGPGAQSSPAPSYPIIVNNFDATGGDNNLPLAAGKDTLSNGKPLDDVLTNYFSTFSPVSTRSTVTGVKMAFL